jgi:uncharacterized protein YndB with AHSA1/START domain
MNAMTDKKAIHLSQSYPVSAAELFELIKTGTLFELTGADEIHFDFWEGGHFKLIFNNRGEIFGIILHIIPNEKIVLDWNVDGFEKEPERNTQVTISLKEDQETTLSIDHTGILIPEAVAAKERAWKEILQDLRAITEKTVMDLNKT